MLLLLQEIFWHLFGAGLLILVLLALARHWNQNWETPPQRQPSLKNKPKKSLLEREITIETEVIPEQRKDLSKILDLAKQNPTRTAQEVRKWLAEGKKKGGSN